MGFSKESERYCHEGLTCRWLIVAKQSFFVHNETAIRACFHLDRKHNFLDYLSLAVKWTLEGFCYKFLDDFSPGVSLVLTNRFFSRWTVQGRSRGKPSSKTTFRADSNVLSHLQTEALNRVGNSFRIARQGSDRRRTETQTETTFNGNNFSQRRTDATVPRGFSRKC